MPFTAENIPDLKGKLILITGANSGLGYQTALDLGKKNATIWLACRDQKKGEEAPQVADEESAKKLWEVSEQLTGVTYSF